MKAHVKTFRDHAHRMVDWMADYLEKVEQFPVKSTVAPGAIYDQIGTGIPETGESLETIFADFRQHLLPGVTHWQHPNFHAYFPANSSVPSLLAEMLTATLGVQGMKWETSPASTELEHRVLEWLRDAKGMSTQWTGVLQDTASTATLAALLSARERATNFAINQNGFAGQPHFRVYCSSETHSSIEKDAKIAGIGSANVVKIEVDDRLAMRPDRLRAAIAADRAAGYVPLCVVATIGTTGTVAIDPLEPLAEIARSERIWLHVDAAYAGTACLLPEYQYFLKGIEDADSYVFNPHKWLFTNFDCTAYYVKDVDTLVRTFAILPEYLKTPTDGRVANHCDWGIPLGRRFRSLKLWFVLRHFGLTGLHEKIRHHINLAAMVARWIEDDSNLALLAPRSINVVVFGIVDNKRSDREVDIMNERLLHRLNDSGRVYLTHTRVRGRYALRMVIGQTYVTEQHVTAAWSIIQATASHQLSATIHQ